jgi:hypothetical protein
VELDEIGTARPLMVNLLRNEIDRADSTGSARAGDREALLLKARSSQALHASSQGETSAGCGNRGIAGERARRSSPKAVEFRIAGVERRAWLENEGHFGDLDALFGLPRTVDANRGTGLHR